MQTLTKSVLAVMLPTTESKIMQCTVVNMSKTSKMPCHSYSLPAQSCKTGSKLAKIVGSVCHGCYALKGFYRMPTVQAPRQANLASLPSEGLSQGWVAWADTMAIQIAKVEKSGFYRWHDSGDLQGDRKSTRLNSSHTDISRMPSSA